MRRSILLPIFNKASKAFFLASAVFLFSGCSAPSQADSLKELDESLGKIFENTGKSESVKLPELFKWLDSEKATSSPSGLSDEEKRNIDEWLEENGYNRYGDSKNAIYTGGTPLFDEKTGKAMDRYEYILKKFPDILKKIK